MDDQLPAVRSGLHIMVNETHNHESLGEIIAIEYFGNILKIPDWIAFKGQRQWRWLRSNQRRRRHCVCLRAANDSEAKQKCTIETTEKQ